MIELPSPGRSALISIAGLFAVIGLLQTGPALAQSHQFYDSNGLSRGYLWCLRRGGPAGGGDPDCSYFTYQQCQLTLPGSNGIDCVRNPWSYSPSVGRARPR